MRRMVIAYAVSRLVLLLPLLVLLLLPAQADMYPNASNAKLPEARAGLGIKSISIKDPNGASRGAICDGASHPLSNYFGTLAAAQVEFPTATALTDELDGVAINNAFAVARALPIVQQQTVYIILDQGVCLASNSINATNLNLGSGGGVEVQATGNLIMSSAVGKTAFDGLCSEHVRWRGLNIFGVGDPLTTPGTRVIPPRIGFLIGNGCNAEVAEHYVEGITVAGNFSLTACYNLTAIATTWMHGTCKNGYGVGAYGFIDDGINHWGVTSDYLTLTTPPDQWIYNAGLWVFGNHVRAVNGSVALWISNFANHHFLGGVLASRKDPACVSSCGALQAVEIYTPTFVINAINLQIEAHTEEPNTAVRDIFFTGPEPNPYVYGLTYKPDRILGSQGIIGADTGVASVYLGKFDLLAPIEWNLSVRLFDDPTKFTFDGNLLMRSTTFYNGIGSQFLGGSVCFSNKQDCILGIGAGSRVARNCGGTTIANPATITNASPAVVTATGFSSGCPLTFTTTGTLPAGITAGTQYYVLTTGYSPGTSSFQIGAAIDGPAINTSSAGSGTHTATVGLRLPASATPKDVLSVVLPEGQFACSGSVFYTPDLTTTTSRVRASLSTTTNVQDGTTGGFIGNWTYASSASAPAPLQALAVPNKAVVVPAGGQTLRLVGEATYAVSGAAMSGGIICNKTL